MPGAPERDETHPNAMGLTPRSAASRGSSAPIWWRWRFQPVFGIWGHLGVDYSFEDPHSVGSEYHLRHVDYGLPGDRTAPGYRHSIALYCAMIAPRGVGWPPLRTPRGRIFRATAFRSAPRAVGEFLLNEVPRFWGDCGAYRTLGPNSNTGLRASLRLCETATGYRFGHPPLMFRIGAWGWGRPCRLLPGAGPFPGYWNDPDRFRWKSNPPLVQDMPQAR